MCDDDGGEARIKWCAYVVTSSSWHVPLLSMYTDLLGGWWACNSLWLDGKRDGSLSIEHTNRCISGKRLASVSFTLSWVRDGKEGEGEEERRKCPGEGQRSWVESGAGEEEEGVEGEGEVTAGNGGALWLPVGLRWEACHGRND